MTEKFKLDLRSLTDSHREIVEAVSIDNDPANVEAISRAYRDAGYLVRSLQLMQARKSGEKRKPDSRQSAGGKARAGALSAERRSEIATEAAQARWAGENPDAKPAAELWRRSPHRYAAERKMKQWESDV